MTKNSTHPDSKFFEYLNGRIEGPEIRSVEEHLAGCEECASAAKIVRAIKSEVSESNATSPSTEHPDVSELASFFYGTGQAASSQVAKHVVYCASCADEIAQYAAGEQAAAEHNVAKATHAAVPAQAWELIREWEESSFAKLKPASEVLSRDLIDRLPSILKTQRSHAVSRRDAQQVQVLVISRSGDVNSVEYFDESIDASGARVLKHSEGSARFDQRLVHAFFEAGGREPVVISELVQSDTLRFEQGERVEELRRAGYFIIDD